VEAHNREPVIIVGGGLSGLAAAVELAGRGIPHLLLEQKPHLGGRAYSFRDRTSGDIVDNGQHALIAGYHHTRKLLSRIRTEDRLSIQPRAELHLHHPDRGFISVRFPPLPPPLHLLWGGLTGSLFRNADLPALVRTGWSLMRAKNMNYRSRFDAMTIREWLDTMDQSAELRRTFWEPLAVSIMNEHIERASAAIFVRALRTAFLGGWHDAALAIPTVGLSELFADPAKEFITGAGGEIRCHARVTRLVQEGTMVAAVETGEGSRLKCRAVILAVPPAAVEPLLPEELGRTGYLHGISELPTSPIVSLHLWFDREIMHQNVLGLVDRRVQWVFKRKGYVSAVMSAAHAFVGMTNMELANIAQGDLKSVFGDQIGPARHILVIREKRATYSSSPEVEDRRPGTTTPLANMFLAGDWTATGYPATIEGAVVSGEAAADAAFRCISRGN
jgi:hydroxysqualene dehydroxylase